MRLAYVCTNFNSSSDTIRAIESLYASDGHEFHCIVVDNHSGAEQVAILRDYAVNKPAIDVIYNPENVGYFRGLNIGLKRLQDKVPKYEHAIVGNNDLVFPVDFADSVERNLGRFDRYPVISPAITTLDGAHQNPHVIARISNFRERMYDLYFSNYYLALLLKWMVRQSRGLVRRGDEDHSSQGQEIWQGHGSCYLLGPRFFTEFGQLWAPTFLFGEEFFLSQQLEAKGLKVYFEPSISLVHAWHSSLASLPTRRQWDLARDAHKVYRNHNPIRPVRRNTAR